MIQGAISKTRWWFCLPREDKSMKRYKEGKEVNQGGAHWRGSLKSGLDLNLFRGVLKATGELKIICQCCILWVSAWKLDFTIMKDLLLLFLCSIFLDWKKKCFVFKVSMSFLKSLSFLLSTYFETSAYFSQPNVSCLFIDFKC